MSITIAEIVKTVYKRGSKKIARENDEQIRQLSGFEEIVRTSLIDKSRLLTDLLNIEIYFFSKKNNESHFNKSRRIIEKSMKIMEKAMKRSRISKTGIRNTKNQ